MAVFGDLWAKTGGSVNWGGVGQSFSKGVSIFFIILLIGILLAIGIYFFLNFLKYNKKVTVFENVAGQGMIPTFKDKAMIVKLGDGGEEVLFLKKKKVYRTAYGKKIGKNHYAFAIGYDGYWYNISFGEIDKQLKELKMVPIDRDMRYMHVAIRRNVDKRFEDKPGFLQKYGGMLLFAFLVFFLVFAMWFLFRQLNTAMSSIARATDVASQVMDKAAQVVSGLDRISTGGTGLVRG